jgi:hypothetical protein
MGSHNGVLDLINTTKFLNFVNLVLKKDTLFQGLDLFLSSEGPVAH